MSKKSIVRTRIKTAVLALGLVFAVGSAQAGLELSKAIVGNLTQIPSGQPFTYRLSYRAASTTTHFYDAVLEDVLPAGLTYISAQGTAHTSSITYNAGTRTVRIVFVNPLLAGSTGQIDLNVRFDKGVTPNGLAVTNTATLTATGEPPSTAPPVVIRATAAGLLNVSKSLVNQSVPLNQNITYTVTASTPTDVGALLIGQLTMTDLLPAGAVFVSATGGGVYDSGTHAVSWDLPDIVPGTANSHSRSITIVYPSAAFAVGAKVTNVVEANGTPLGGSPTNRTASLVSTVVAPTAGASFSKSVDGNYVYEGKAITKQYSLGSVKNSGNTELNDVVVTDPIPAAVWVYELYTGSYSGSPAGLGTGITVEYRTNLRGWTTITGSPFSGASSQKITVASLGLAANEAISDLRWSFGTLPATYQTTNLKFSGEIRPVDRNGVQLLTGDRVRNTASMDYTDFNGAQTKTSTADITVKSPRPVVTLEKGFVGGGSTLAHGATGTFYVRLRNSSYAATPMDNPVLADLLPATLTYLSGADTVYRKPAGAPDPVFEQIDNYNGTGRTLLRWKWTGASAYSLPVNDYIEIRFQAVQPIGTLYGSKANDVTLAGWDNDHIDASSTSTRADSTDLDGDGNTSESVFYKSFTWNVPSEVSMDSQKWVKGTLDNDWSRYPDSSSVPGGRADYKLIVKNSGNVPIKDVVVDDILPFIGDGGVIDLSPRISEWRPNLAGPVLAPPNVVVYYSTSENPTRTDFVPAGPIGSTPANWSTSAPGNITRVRALKFVFQNFTLPPQESIELTWPMRVPVGAPTGEEIAWNSFGFYGTRTDTSTQLLPSEPLKVGIKTVMDTNSAYGNRVWFDANKDGVQQPEELGVNGIRVELWEDSSESDVPDGIINTNSDRFVGWTITGDDQDGNAGYYLFPNLQPGSYYARFDIPDPYVVTAYHSGTDVSVDSDLDPITRYTPIYALGAVTNPERNDTFDAGVWLPPYGVTLVKTAGTAPDGGIYWTNLNQSVTYAYTLVNTGELALIDFVLTDDVLGPIANLPATLAAGASTTIYATMPAVAADVINIAMVQARPADALGREIPGAPPAEDSDDAVVKLYAAIGNQVWEDFNANGTQDSGEPGVPGVAVTLLDAANNVVGTKQTDNNGRYAFVNLIPGAYSVRFSPPASYLISPLNQGANNAKDSDADGVTGQTILVTLGSGVTDNTWDCGIYRLAALGDYVWLDANLNGVQDSGEAGVPDVTVRLLNATNGVVATTTTDGTGAYHFTGLYPGTYAIAFDLLPGFVFTAQDAGGNDAKDSDANTVSGRTSDTVLVSGESDNSWDAGLHQPAAGITLVKTAGAAADGTTLLAANGQDVVYTYVVSNSGNTFLAPITVTDDKLGTVGTLAGPLAPGASATLTATAHHVVENVTNIGTVSGIPTDAFGRPLTSDPVSDTDDAVVVVEAALGDRVWLDTNHNGIQDPSESGLPGVTVILLDASSVEVSRTTTDATGTYGFAHLAPGQYRVSFVAPPNYFFTTYQAGGKAGYDSDAAPGTGLTDLITLIGGQSDLSWDAGLYYAVPAIQIVKTAGDAPDGEAFIVYGHGSVTYTYAVTNSGQTHLSNVKVTDDVLGDIGVVAGPLAPGATFVLTYTVSNVTANVTNIGTVTANPTDEAGQDLPNVADVTDSDDAVVTVLPRASVGNYVWVDASRDGIQDANEPGLIGVTVALLDAAGHVVATTSTDVNGFYLFADLIPGDYQIRFDLPGAAWHFTVANAGGDDEFDSDAQVATGLTGLFSLASGQDDMSWDAGVYGGLPPGFCDTMGFVQLFNAMIFGDFIVTGSGDTEGRLAVAGTAWITSGYSVGIAVTGEPIPVADNATDHLIVGNDLYDGYWEVNGNIVYGGTRYGPAKDTGIYSIRHAVPVTFDAAGNVPADGSGMTFDVILAQLRLASVMIGNMDDRGVVTKDVDKGDHILTFVGNDPQLNIFNVSATDWSLSQSDIHIQAPAGSTVVFNIHGAAATLVNGSMVLSGGVTRNTILFNYVDAVELTTESFSHEGTVLAMYADAHFTGGSIEGSAFLGGTVNSDQGFEFHNFPFRGNICVDDDDLPGIALIVTADSAADGTVLTVASNATVAIYYYVQNTGDTWLNAVTVTDQALGLIGTLVQPLAPGESALLLRTVVELTADTVFSATATGYPTDHDGNAWTGYGTISASDAAEVQIASAPEGGGGNGGDPDPGAGDASVRPDFAVTAVSFISKPTLTGEVFSVSVTVDNHGDVAADGGVLTLYLSEPLAVATGTPGDASVQVGLLQPGETQTFTFTDLRAGAGAGTHHVRAFVDSLGSVQEWSDGDNQMGAVYEINQIWMHLTVVPGGIQLSWNSYWGQVYTVMATDNLAHPFAPMIETIDATPPENTQFIANPPGGMFFKLRVDQR